VWQNQSDKGQYNIVLRKTHKPNPVNKYY